MAEGGGRRPRHALGAALRTLRRTLRGATGADAAPAAREAQLAAWNTKVMGSWLAARLYETGVAGFDAPRPPDPVTMDLGGRLCRQEDIEAAWLRHWCGRIGFVPLYHRKVWEDCYALQQMHDLGALRPGARALGFAVGAEWIPSFLAANGLDVLATDLDAGHEDARPWVGTGQHGGEVATIHKPGLIDEEGFAERVALRSVDMNAIPADLHGDFDLVWSVCSLEHCGSIAAGLDFVVNAMRCLRPGGIAVHTTEFNLAANGPTIEAGRTVLFQRRHLEALGDRLAAAGHRMLPMDWGVGGGVLDAFVDLPPYPNADWPLPISTTPHLRLSVLGHVCTSVGFAIVAGGA